MMDLSKLKNNDSFWWWISCFTGSVVWSFPLLGILDGKGADTYSMVAMLILLIAGTAFGYYKPEKSPWRWALASVIALPFIELITLALLRVQDSGLSSIVQSIPYLLLKLVTIYPLQGLPVFIGTYLGAYLSKRAGKEQVISMINEKKKFRWLGFIFGFVFGGIPLLTSNPEEVPVLAIMGIFLCSVCLAVYKPSGVWRWAFAVGLSLPAAVIIRAFIDLLGDPTSHNLIPFEIVFSMVYAFPGSFVGAYLGMLIAFIYSKRAYTHNVYSKIPKIPKYR